LRVAELTDRQGRTPKKQQAAGRIMALALDITESMRAINIQTYENRKHMVVVSIVKPQVDPLVMPQMFL
jgi:hypothetical protein